MGSSWIIYKYHEKRYKSAKNPIRMILSEIPLSIILYSINSIQGNTIILLDESYRDMI
jgi:hypothetical protein